MAKETYYFSHDYNARMDVKIRNLIMKHSMLGYGIYWAIIEDLYNNGNTFPANYETLAFELRVSVEVVKSVVNDFALFVVNDVFFSSDSVKRRLAERNEKSESAKNKAKKRWDNAAASKNDATAMPQHSNSNADAMLLKERKGKEIKGKEIKEKESKGKESTPRTPEILFRDSEFFDFKKFEAEFTETKYNVYNLEFYYESVLNWSNSRNAKKVDWIATARNFMIGDSKESKAVLKHSNLTQNASAPKNRQQTNISDYQRELAAEMGFTSGKS